MLMIFTYIFYYILSIFTVLLCVYFRRFTLSDYQYNPSLRKKRRYAIIWTYAVMCLLQAPIIGTRMMFIYPIDNSVIVLVALFFGILYIILLGRLEIPKQTHKKKKSLNSFQITVRRNSHEPFHLFILQHRLKKSAQSLTLLMEDIEV